VYHIDARNMEFEERTCGGAVKINFADRKELQEILGIDCLSAKAILYHRCFYGNLTEDDLSYVVKKVTDQMLDRTDFTRDRR
jgi:DNA uptake protein ComE-like DNA-binding protein